MPWKECHVMDERLRFVARLLDGERTTTLYGFGISRSIERMVRRLRNWSRRLLPYNRSEVPFRKRSTRT